MMLDKTVAIFLKENRIAKGLTQKEVADRLGYANPQFVSNWERGISLPPLPALKQLADIYSVSQRDMYKILLEHSLKQVEAKLEKKFFNKKSARRA